MTKQERLQGCIIAGAIGDAWGSAYENAQVKRDDATFYLTRPKTAEPNWIFTDDTQMTLVTLAALVENKKLTPDILSSHMVHYFKKGFFTGLGASTLKALQELVVGGHWSQVGRTGEYAAGNGAAMRIAPFAFWENYSREEIRDFCRITHRNDEAYVGAVAVWLSIQEIINNNWTGNNSLIDLLIPQLPDTRVRDRLIELNSLDAMTTITDVAKFGVSGYVVDSVPFSIFCASKVQELGLSKMFEEIIACGGDTDTNATIAGQIAGAFVGRHDIPASLMNKLETVRKYDWLMETIEKASTAVSTMSGP